MVKTILLRCFEIIKKKPLTLWGVSLLGVLLVSAAGSLGILPIISIPVALAIEAGMCAIYLKGVRGEHFEVESVFDGFKNFWHVIGGMAWMSLWIFLWSIIPVVGVVFGIMKTYEYRFTPFILMNEPEVSAVDALKLSQKRTFGYKGSMFLSDLVSFGAVFVVCLVLVLLGLIPYVGYLFWTVLMVFTLAVSAFAPLWFGILKASFVEESANPTIPLNTPGNTAAPTGFTSAPTGFTAAPPAGSAPYASPAQSAPPAQAAPADEVAPAGEVAPAMSVSGSFCPKCGNATEAGQKFCNRCGAQL